MGSSSRTPRENRHCQESPEHTIRCRRNSPVGITTPPTPARASPAPWEGASCPAAPVPVSTRARPRTSPAPNGNCEIIGIIGAESSQRVTAPATPRPDPRYPHDSTFQTTPSTRSRVPSRLPRSATPAARFSTGTTSRPAPRTRRPISASRRRRARGSAPPPSAPRSSFPPRSSATYTPISSRRRSARSSSARSPTTSARPSRRNSSTAGRRWPATTKH